MPHSSARPTGDAVGGLLLAAGAGTRYGRPKALAEHGRRRFVEIALRTLLDGGCDPVVVVLGAEAQQVSRCADLTGATLAFNPQWRLGIGGSLRTGLRTLATTRSRTDSEPTAAVVLLVDTPGITAAAVRRIARYGLEPAALVSASYHGQPGHPVLLGRRHWDGVCQLAVGDIGARPYLLANEDLVVTVDCSDIADGTDLDEPTTAKPDLDELAAAEPGLDMTARGGAASATNRPHPPPANRARSRG